MDFNKIAAVNVNELSDEELAEHLDNIRKRIRDKKTGTVRVKKESKKSMSDLAKLSDEDKLKLLAALGVKNA